LGVVLYEMLAGRSPFDAATPVALADAYRQPAPPLPEAPPELAELVLACLAIDPAERPTPTALVAQRLRDWLAAQSPAVEPDASVGAATAAEPTATATVVVPSVAAGSPGRARSGPR